MKIHFKLKFKIALFSGIVATSFVATPFLTKANAQNSSIQVEPVTSTTNQSNSDYSQTRTQIESSSTQPSSQKTINTVEVLSDYYTQQNQTYFRDGASGEISSISVQTRGRKSLLSQTPAHEAQPLQLGWLIADRYSATENWNYFKPQELYLEYKKPKWFIAVGMKQMDSLQTNKVWSNPIWFSRYREDKINMQTIGPLGLHTQNQLPQGWTISTSLIAAHAPDFGPGQRVIDGEFVSKNPWFRPPPDQVILDLSETTARRIEYSLAPYKVTDIINKPGAILQIDKKIDSRQNIKLIGARKALPALHLSFPVIQRQLDNDEYLDLAINPASIYHTAAAIEWTYQTTEEEKRQQAVFASFQYENPDQPVRPNSWISQNFKESYVASAGYKQTFNTSFFPLGLELSYWQVWGGDGPDKGDNASVLSVYERRYDFVQAVKLGASIQKNRYSTSTAFIYDVAQEGVLWSNRIHYRLNKEWAMSGLLDIMGLLGPTGRVPDGLISLYRANDRLGLGVSYVF